MQIYEFTSSLSRKRALRSLLSLIACSSWLAKEWRSDEDFSLSRSISLRMSTTSLSYLPWERRKRQNYLKGFSQNPSWQKTEILSETVWLIKKTQKKQCNKKNNRSKISLIWNLLESNMFLVLNQDNWQKAFLVVEYFLAVECILLCMRTHTHVRYYGKRFLSFLLTLVVKKWEMHDLAFPIIILSFKNKKKRLNQFVVKPGCPEKHYAVLQAVQTRLWLPL